MDRQFVARHITAHRGRWDSATPQNSPAAFEAALTAGTGIETDLRDLAGGLVISHDPPTSSTATSFGDFCTLVAGFPAEAIGPLALNVKSDGLAPMIDEWLGALPPEGYFFFDMTFPQTLVYSRRGLPVAIRISEYEPIDQSLPDRVGAQRRWWLDAFDSDWWLNDFRTRAVLSEGQTHLVSPEIHGRDPRPAWDWFGAELSAGADVYLCTDRVDEVLEVLA